MDAHAPVSLPEILHFGRYTFNMWTRDVSCGDRATRLTQAEAVLFRAVGEKAGEHVSQHMLAKTYADYFKIHLDCVLQTNVMDVAICRLRRKLRSISPDDESGLVCKRKVGYILEIPSSPAPM